MIVARLFFLRPALRWSLGLLWIATGLLSFGLYPIEKSYALLAQIGLHDAGAAAALLVMIALEAGTCWTRPFSRQPTWPASRKNAS